MTRTMINLFIYYLCLVLDDGSSCFPFRKHLGACRWQTPRACADLKAPKDASPRPSPIPPLIRSSPQHLPPACTEKLSSIIFYLVLDNGCPVLGQAHKWLAHMCVHMSIRRRSRRCTTWTTSGSMTWARPERAGFLFHRTSKREPSSDHPNALGADLKKGTQRRAMKALPLRHPRDRS